MASPDTDQGFVKLAHELLTAIGCAGFTGHEFMILSSRVFVQVFNRTDKLCYLSASEIGRASQVDAGTIRQAIRDLVSSNVLLKVSDQTYRLNKDYDTWTKNEAPRLSEERRKMARDAVQFAALIRSSHPCVGQGKNSLPPRGKTPYPLGEKLPTDDENASDIAPACDPAYAPASGELEEKEREKEGEGGEKENPSPTESETDSNIDPRPDRQELPSAPYANPPEAVEAVVKLVTELFPMSCFSALARNECRHVKAIWVEDAILAIHATGREVPWTYAQNIIKRYRSKGCSPSEEAARIKPDPSKPEAATRASDVIPIRSQYESPRARDLREAAEAREMARKQCAKVLAELKEKRSS